MKVLSMVLAVTALSAGQPARAPVAGSWTATFQDRTFIRLEIKTVDGAMTGGISVGRFEVDPQGMVRRADAAPLSLRPIFDATWTGSTVTSVTFFAKDVNDTDKFELRVLDDYAELRLLLNDDDRAELAASGIPLPKPIRLRKVG